jgi:hypothetical protein
MLEEVSNLALDSIKLVQLESWVGDCKDVPGLGLLVDEDPLSIPEDFLFDLEQAFAFQHDGEDVSRGAMAGVLQLDQLAQKRFSIFLLDGIGWGCRRLVDAVPIGDEALALASRRRKSARSSYKRVW